MSDSDETPDELPAEKPKRQKGEPKAEPPAGSAPVLKAFMYPTIGDGVTIFAKDQADADAQAAVHPLNRKG